MLITSLTSYIKLIVKKKLINKIKPMNKTLSKKHYFKSNNNIRRKKKNIIREFKLIVRKN
jgi:hypothetical protein